MRSGTRNENISDGCGKPEPDSFQCRTNMKAALFVALVAVTCDIVTCQERSTMEILMKMFEFANSLDFSNWSADKAGDVMQKLREVFDLPQAGNISSSCVSAISGPEFRDHWQTYLDAFAKPGSGISQGNVWWLGSYDECRRIPSAHFCISKKVRILSKSNLNLGICLPKKCSEADILTVLQYIAIVANSSSFAIDSNPNQFIACYKDEYAYQAGTIVMFGLSGCLLLLLAAGTLCDFMQPDRAVEKSDKSTEKLLSRESDSTFVCRGDSLLRPLAPDDAEPSPIGTSMATADTSEGHVVVRVLLCFSLLKNTRSIFDTNLPAASIGCINGIRTLSMLWVILGHTVSFLLTDSVGAVPVDNKPAQLRLISTFSFQTVLNALLAVDSFFLITGVLVSYLGMKRYKHRGRLSLIKHFLLRYLRLTPTYAYTLFMFTYVAQYMGDGPLWLFKAWPKAVTGPCEGYWWSNLIYVNNFYPKTAENMCMSWTWYLANDMQFYVISPVILFLMVRWKLFGAVAGCGIMLLGSFVATAVLMVAYEASPVMALDAATGQLRHEWGNYNSYLYYKPYCRVAPYLVGAVLGYLLHEKASIKFHVGKNWVFYLSGWFAAAGIGMAVIYGPSSTSYRVWSVAENALYGTLSRFSWGLALAWVIYVCHNGYGGVVNEFLSWKAFVPLSRLTFAAYLTHPMVLYMFFSTQRVPIHYSPLYISYMYASFVGLSYAVAYVVAVGVEYPVRGLCKMLNF